MQRRTLLEASGLTVISGATAGCLGGLGTDDGEQPAPIDLSGQQLDDQGGMVIGQHGGPNGQIFYADHSPEGHDNPARFHTLSSGLFPYYFEHREWTVEAIYATDYSVVDASVREENGAKTIPAPTAAETFGDATELFYVMESEVMGGMGPGFVPFSKKTDAESFLEEHGGKIVRFDDVSPQLLSSYTG
jgi:nitrous oxide reductase accessory protein NosL